MKNFVVYAKCCRWWPIIPYLPVGRCGICETRPDMDHTLSEEEFNLLPESEKK